MQKYKLYPYGFIFSKNSLTSVPDYYTSRLILNKYHFNYDITHPIGLLENDNDFILIHGHYQYVGSNTKLIDEKSFLSTLKDIYHNDYEEFLNSLDFIGGRYCIILGNNNNIEVYQDATGARSIYYSLDEDVISSHANLINDNFKCDPFNYGIKSTYPRFSFDNSPYSNVKALVPNFKLKLKDKTIERFFPRQKNKYTHLSDIEKILLVEKLWTKQLKYYYQNYENLLISITGGNDSRISLALSKFLKDNLQFFTYCKNPENINPSIKRETVNDKDRTIVEQILNDITLNHKFIYYDDNDLDVSQDIDYVLSKNSIAKHGRFLINLYLKNFPNENNMHLRGTCLEIVQSVYLNPDNNPNNEKAVLDRYLFTAKKFFHLLEEDDFKKIGFYGIQKLGYNLQHYDFHVLDLYYWEHRMGRWHPELLNETDIAFDTFLPFNLRAILEIGMSFSLEKRKSGFLFKELINNSFPILNFYGVNNVHNIYEQNKIFLNGLNDHVKKNSIQQSSYFSEFHVYNHLENKITYHKSRNNIIYIPSIYFSKNNHSSVDLYFTLENGFIELKLLSNYKNLKAKNHLTYQILVNNVEILNEDMSQWDLENNINIFNLIKGDLVTIRVTALKTLERKSWEKASMLEIKHLKEIEIPQIENLVPSVTSTSPYSIIE